MTEITIPYISFAGGVLILCASLALNIVTTYLFHHVTKIPSLQLPDKSKADPAYLYPPFKISNPKF